MATVLFWYFEQSSGGECGMEKEQAFMEYLQGESPDIITSKKG
jgi:hypothetical protein